jgi:twinkle protein
LKQFSDYGISIPAGSHGEIKALCPQCSGQRKKSGVKVLNVNVDEGVWHCWHCDWSGSLKQGIWKPAQIRITYKRPAIVEHKIKPAWREWLNKRGISDTVIAENCISTQRIYMPQIEGEADTICFPFYRNGEIINAKYRDLDKNFRMSAGSERILYGLDHIDDKALIWVEGEMDKLSVYQAGFRSCVSVPDGAPAVSAKNYSSKFDYLESAQDRLNKVERHIIAVDADEPGQKLKNELVRRLGIGKAYIATWPEGCKDANDTLREYGADAVAQAIQMAKPAPVEGVFYVQDILDEMVELYDNGEVGGLPLGWDNMRELFSIRLGDFTVFTGIPSHGKSEFLDMVIIQMARLHGLRFALCSPENQPIKLHLKKLAEKWAGKPFFKDFACNYRMSQIEMLRACDELQEHISFIMPEEPTIDCILERAKIEVFRRGINGLIIDPWNELEHSRPTAMSETEYIGECLRKMRKFAREHNIHLFIVAHPTKMRKNEAGQYDIPTPYDISGSANWRNKADNCIAIYRNADSVDVYVQKVRVKEVGRVGKARFTYDIPTGRYFEVNQ